MTLVTTPQKPAAPAPPVQPVVNDTPRTTSQSYRTQKPAGQLTASAHKPTASSHRSQRLDKQAPAPTAPAVSQAQLANILSQQTHFSLDMRVDDAFTAAKKSHQFTPAPPNLLARKWSSPVPGFNPDSDQPRQKMKFYDFGWQGYVERGMDFLLQTRSHTLAYGTKVECLSLLGIISTVCAWGASEVSLNPAEEKRLADLYADLHNRPLWRTKRPNEITASEQEPSPPEKTVGDDETTSFLETGKKAANIDKPPQFFSSDSH